MQIHRLTQIVFALLQGEKVTAKSLAERFEVSARTVYRDIDVLCAAGIPIYTDKGSGGGISIAENYRLKNAMLSDSEKQNIIAMLKAFNAMGGDNETSALLDKLSGIFRTTDNCIEVDFSDWHNDGSVQRAFSELRESIARRRVVAIEYRRADGEICLREVEPLKLLFKHKNWYLYAYCRMRDQPRVFKLARIMQTKVLTKQFDRECCDSEISRNFDWKSDSVEMSFTLKKQAAPRVWEMFCADSYTVDEKGDFHVKIFAPCDDWMLSCLLSFGDLIQMHEPLWLKEKLRQIHESAAKNA